MQINTKIFERIPVVVLMNPKIFLVILKKEKFHLGEKIKVSFITYLCRPVIVKDRFRL